MPQKIGAEGGIRTRTDRSTAPSRQRVYQFHHFGVWRSMSMAVLMVRVMLTSRSNCAVRLFAWRNRDVGFERFFVRRLGDCRDVGDAGARCARFGDADRFALMRVKIRER